jgi:hypothetical protein
MARLERQEMNFESYVLTLGPYDAADIGATQTLLHTFDRETVVDQIQTYVLSGTDAACNAKLAKLVAGETSMATAFDTTRPAEYAAGNYANHVQEDTDLNATPADGAVLDSETVTGFRDDAGPTGAAGEMRAAGAHFNAGDSIFVDIDAADTGLVGLTYTLRCRERITE